MNDNQDHSEKYLTFSQREGYESMPEPMSSGELSTDLRKEIWNETRRLLLLMRAKSPLDIAFFGAGDFGEDATRVIERIMGKLQNTTEDEISTDFDVVQDTFKNHILDSPFNVVLDLVESILYEIPKLKIKKDRFSTEIRRSFEKHSATYRLDTSSLPPRFFARCTKMQGEATRSAIETIRASGMEGADTHLREAATHINGRRFADSIRNSIHAVESVARTIDPRAKTLGPALDSLQKSGLLKHPALKEAFSKLYGYTSDEQGIRHALLDKGSPDVDLDEAMFMFGACASFAAYLVNKHRKAAQTQGSGQ